MRYSTRSVLPTRSLMVATAAVAGALAVSVPGAAGAAPASPAPAAPDTTQNPGAPTEPPAAGEPMPVAAGAYSYIATRDMTVRASSMNAPEAIASFPVPERYRPANLAMAAQFDIALQSAIDEPGACLQIVVDPQSKTGDLFDYGFFPVAKPYCP